MMYTKQDIIEQINITNCFFNLDNQNYKVVENNSDFTIISLKNDIYKFIKYDNCITYVENEIKYDKKNRVLLLEIDQIVLKEGYYLEINEVKIDNTLGLEIKQLSYFQDYLFIKDKVQYPMIVSRFDEDNNIEIYIKTDIDINDIIPIKKVEYSDILNNYIYSSGVNIVFNNISYYNTLIKIKEDVNSLVVYNNGIIYNIIDIDFGYLKLENANSKNVRHLYFEEFNSCLFIDKDVYIIDKGTIYYESREIYDDTIFDNKIITKKYNNSLIKKLFEYNIIHEEMNNNELIPKEVYENNLNTLSLIKQEIHSEIFNPDNSNIYNILNKGVYYIDNTNNIVINLDSLLTIILN